ncbi:hypothetical protein ACL6C3_05500 [Capilliphycus salinus ALCB114379]|uniref:hypothetical protein n=1 Tax=Capilliphycus salinus TaxID=2768948 RepID=UPI0039A44058
MNFRQQTTGIVSVIAMLASFGLNAAKATAETFDFSITYDTVFDFNFESLEVTQPGVEIPESIDITPLIDNLPEEYRAVLPEDFSPIIDNPSIIDVFGSGVSTEPDVPFGFTNFTTDTYGLPITLESVPDPETGEPLPVRQLIIFRADPNDFSLNLPSPEFSDVYSGENTDNKLFGLANDQAILNIISPTEGTVAGGGIITLVGGEGTFEGAVGQISFNQSDTFNPSDDGPTLGQATLEFSIETPQEVPEPGTPATLLGLGVIGSGVLLRRRNKKQF